MAISASPGPSVEHVERFRDVPRYLWLVLASAFLGWMFDAMDLNIFSLILFPSVSDLLGTTNRALVAQTGGLIVGIKLFAWGIGGALFGIVADRFGRARTMIATIIIYSVFTGLSALARNWGELAFYQAVAGVGIGGEWAAGAALIAETWPDRLRPRAMQIMQLAFAVGFFAAALINLFVGPIGWRWVFAAGAVPVVVTLGIRRYIREPERWLAVRGRTYRVGRIFEPDLRRGTIVGVLVAMAMMIGSWGGITWIPSWIPQLLGPERAKNAPSYIGHAFMLLNAGALLGYLTLMWLVEAIGRRKAYFVFCLGSLLSALSIFTQVRTFEGLQALMPIYGYFAVGGFGTFAVYLPELFPTSVRATGQGFCWNIARFFTGFGPWAGGALVGVLGSFPAAAAAVSLVFVVGLVAIWFGPETKGRPLRDY